MLKKKNIQTTNNCVAEHTVQDIFFHMGVFSIPWCVYIHMSVHGWVCLLSCVNVRACLSVFVILGCHCVSSGFVQFIWK